jgi:hypothetical protein
MLLCSRASSMRFGCHPFWPVSNANVTKMWFRLCADISTTQKGVCLCNVQQHCWE